MQHDDHELQLMWAAQQRLLAENLRLNRKILARLTFEPIQRSLNRGAILMFLGALPAVVIVPWLANFAYEHWSESRFALPAILLQLYVLFLVSLRVRYIMLTARIEYSNTMLEIQRQIAELRRSSLLMFKCVMLTAVLIWPVLLVVMLKGFIGIDAYQAFGWSWLLWNLLAGFAVIPVVLWIAKQFGEGGGGGYFLNRAQRLLEKLEEPEKET